MEGSSEPDPFENRPADRKLHDAIFADFRQLCVNAQKWKIDIAPVTRAQFYVPDERNRAVSEIQQLGDIDGSLVVKYKIRWIYEFENGPYILDGRRLWSFEASYPTIISVFSVTCHILCMIVSFEMVSEHARGVVAVYRKDEPSSVEEEATTRTTRTNAWAKAKRLLNNALSTTFRGLTPEQMERLQRPDWDYPGDPPSRPDSRRRDGSSTLDPPESDEEEGAVDELESEVGRPTKMAKKEGE